MVRFFKGQEKRVAKALDKATKAIGDDIQNGLEQMWINEDELLQDTLNGIWLTSGELGFFTANSIFDLGLTWEVVRPEWLEAIKQFGAQQVSEINTTTKNALIEQIQEGIAEGESIPDIAKRIDEVFNTAQTTRAITIARTETHTATVGGTFTTYKAAGFRAKEWLTSIDGREREWHGTMDGQIVGIDEPFISGQGNELMFPGDPSAPANEIINCRCAVVPVTEVT